MNPVTTFIAVWAAAFFIWAAFTQPTIEEVRDVCSDHGGVQSFEGVALNPSLSDARALVICKDGEAYKL